jgi:AAA family ATP:ADP antiporter
VTEQERTERGSVLDRALGVFAEVRAGEAITALLLVLCLLLLLSAYYVIKPVREALILQLESGAEYKSYMSAVIAVLLLGLVPAYARLVERVRRNRLIVTVTLFFASHLVLFYFGSFVPAVMRNIGLVFYAWVGIFNMMLVAQLWAFANDLYTEEQGKRLFPIVGIGASAGAVGGSTLKLALSGFLGVYESLLVSAGLLVLVAVLVQIIHQREEARRERLGAEKPGASEVAKQSSGKRGAYQLVFQNRYLLLIALFSVVFTLINTNGEYLLGKLVKATAQEQVASGALAPGEVKEFIDAKFSQFYFYVNWAGVLLQAFVVSRLVKYGGLGVALFVFPVVACAGALGVLAMPVLGVLFWSKIAENSTDYSVNNTVRNMLWLPTTREMKYKAKQAVDTFFIRMGDVSSALVVFVGVELLDLGVRGFVSVNLVAIVIWLLLSVQILRAKKELPPTSQTSPAG